MASIMNKSSSLFGDDFFDDSSLLANLENSAFEDNIPPHRTDEKTGDKSFLNVSALCCDEEISGYDKLTGNTWVYPINYPERDYQFNIIKSAILKNTLVSLPTGLGKTFIAAVIMYNFYRWYPTAKIIFTAPTRPLVAQQIEACCKIVAIPSSDTIEMTGHMPVNTRKTHWQSKRVFFATPQVIYNDIKSGICPGQNIRCLVIDEAHRARGNYAYGQIISTLTEMGHRIYRVLALSATPGSKVEDVVNVVKSLHIAHLELRTENCIDVVQYSHSRKITTAVIPLGSELTHLRNQYVDILDGYARRLKQFNILPQNLGNLSKGRVIMLYKEYQSRDRGARHPQHNYIMKDFTLIISLYHGLELLVKHGSRVFLNFFDEHPEKSWIQSDDKLTALLERLRDDLGIDPFSLDRSVLPDGTVPEVPKDLVFGHPKFCKLQEIMLEHFNKAKHMGQDTKAIVFCEYRESVNLVHCLLLQCRPLITPQMFVGQGASGKNGKTMVSQKQQLRVMRKFRSGECNTLVCTCVAEEGLDVGSVDLIICFDISTRSPIRLVQRCGRTGRERGGQVYILVTEGKEHQTLLDCMRQRDGLNKRILQSKEVENNLYTLNPRMIPHDFLPKCHKMYMTITKNDTKENTKGDAGKLKKGQKDLRNMLIGKATTSKDGKATSDFRNSEWLTEAEFDALYPKGYIHGNFFAQPVEYWSMNEEMLTSNVTPGALLNLNKWLDLQRTLQATIQIGHSVDTNILTDLLQYNNSQDLKLSLSTQNNISDVKDLVNRVKSSSPSKPKQTCKKQKATIIKSPNKNGDIRALFSTATKSTKSYTKLIKDLDVEGVPTRIVNLLVDLALAKANSTKKCYFCENVCDCLIIQKLKSEKKTVFPIAIDNTPCLSDVDMIDNLNAETFLQYFTNTSNNRISIDNNNIATREEKNNMTVNNFDLQFDFDSLLDTDSQKEKVVTAVNDSNIDTNFDIGNLEDIFADNSPPLIKENLKKSKDPDQTLEYFGLGSVEDIFIESDDEGPQSESEYRAITNITSPICNRSNNYSFKSSVETNKFDLLNMRPTSPSILSGRAKVDVVPITSPILLSQKRKFKCTPINNMQSSTPHSSVKKKLNLETQSKLQDYEKTQTTITDTSNKSMLTITQLVNMINTADSKGTSFKKSIDCNNSFSPRRTPSVSRRETSPILLTQRDKEISTLLGDLQDLKQSNPICNTSSIIIPDSDSDFEDDIEKTDTNKLLKGGNNETNRTPTKRRQREDDDITASPYFGKKQKIGHPSQPLSMQEKILAALKSEERDSLNVNMNANFVIYSPTFTDQKENIGPSRFNSPESDSDGKKLQSNLAKLQMFRRHSKASPNKVVMNDSTNVSDHNLLSSRFDDSDDDFIDSKKPIRNQSNSRNDAKNNPVVKHKEKKKSVKKNEFLDLEAELSDDGGCGSGDELSDESVGSIIDFICDNNESHENEDDMHALYLRSVKSPVKGVFKIPQRRNDYDKLEVLSQFVEEDTYEMDSFCVDSHVGLTQVNEEVSELEVAEMLLEEKRRNRKTSKRVPKPSADSPIIRKRKNVRRQIQSDSEDSS